MEEKEDEGMRIGRIERKKERKKEGMKERMREKDRKIERKKEMVELFSNLTAFFKKNVM